MEIYFGKNIRFLRNKQNMTQEDLGKVFSVKNTTVGGWEKGNSYPEFKILVEMRVYFGVDLERLLFSDLSDIMTTIVEESPNKYHPQQPEVEIRATLEKVKDLEAEMSRLRGEVNKMGVMEARMQLLERQLELLMSDVRKRE